jgi:putative phosphoserine phosphatase/1-acylglycerol-3-phosphate O-acyltransferase
MTRLAVIDLDGTLIKGQSQRILLEVLRRHGLVPRLDYYLLAAWFGLYRAGLLNNADAMRTFAYSRFHDLPVETVNAALEDSFSRFAKRIYNGAHDLVRGHLDQADSVMLLSASIRPIVARIAREFGIVDYLCTDLEVAEGRFTGRILGPPLYGSRRVTALKEVLRARKEPIDELLVYTDHHSDIELLELADTPVCVHPDRRLKKIAAARGWSIRSLE